MTESTVRSAVIVGVEGRQVTITAEILIEDQRFFEILGSL